LGTILERREKPHERVRVAGTMYVKAQKHLVLSTLLTTGPGQASDYPLPEKDVDLLYDVVDPGPVPPAQRPHH
jgi:hypothetical protein